MNNYEKRSERQREREGYFQRMNAEFQSIAKRYKKAFLSEKCKLKKERKTIEWERLKISSRKLEIPREYFMQRWAQ